MNTVSSPTSVPDFSLLIAKNPYVAEINEFVKFFRIRVYPVVDGISLRNRRERLKEVVHICKYLLRHTKVLDGEIGGEIERILGWAS